jgi:uncharacterized protein
MDQLFLHDAPARRRSGAPAMRRRQVGDRRSVAGATLRGGPPPPAGAALPPPTVGPTIHALPAQTAAMPITMPSDADLRRILRGCRTVAVVGLSDQWHRPSFFVAKYLQQHGYRVIPVNPRLAGGQILGETVHASLDDIGEPVDMVDVFRRSAEVPPIAEQAVRIGAKCLWQQIGVASAEADAVARAAGLDSVLDRCTKIEHARLFGGLHWAGVNTGVLSAQRRG